MIEALDGRQTADDAEPCVITQPTPLSTPTFTPCIDGTPAHHYLIESPNGATSQGVCKKCGVEKVFRNRVDTELTLAKGMSWSELTDYEKDLKSGRAEVKGEWWTQTMVY